MVRDLRRLADERFDLVVVGAGIYGVAAAWDGAQRGLRVALIDRGDFGGGTSANSLKTLHGGLRSLQSLNLPQMRLFIRERRAMARLVPHLVRRLPFCVPTYRDPRRSALLMRLALAITDEVGHDRHVGLAEPALHLPGGRVVSRDECLARNPIVDPNGVTGGALWHDYQMRHADRIALAFVESAAAAGAAVANYVRADGLLIEQGRVAGITATDALGGQPLTIQARSVLNAAGPWAGEFLRRVPGGVATTPAPALSRAMNLVVRRVTGEDACGGLAQGRFLFCVPWRDVSILGTSHDAHSGPADALVPDASAVDTMLADAAEAFPRAGLSRADVRLIHRGLLPMVDGHGTHVRLLRESAVVDHARDGAPGLVSMFGVRYTTARHTAQAAIDAVFRVLGHDMPPPCRTATTALAGGHLPSLDTHSASARAAADAALDADTCERMAGDYGTAWTRVRDLVRAEPALAATLGPGCRVTGAEVVDAVRNEAAVHLSDVVLRRTEAGSAGHPGPAVLDRAADLMAAELGWSAARRSEEVSETASAWALPW